MYFRQCIVCVVLERAPKIIPAICTPHFAESIFQARSKAYFPDQAICSTVSRGFIEYLLFLLLPQKRKDSAPKQNPSVFILPFYFTIFNRTAIYSFPGSCTRNFPLWIPPSLMVISQVSIIST